MKKVLVAAATCFLSVNLMAEGAGEKKGFEIKTSLYNYKTDTTKTKVGSGTEGTVKSTELSMPNSLELIMDATKMVRIYIYPLQANPDAGLGIGYRAMPNLEVGVRIGLVSTTQDKPKDNTSSTGLGLFGVYTHDLGASSLDFKASFGSRMDKSEDETSGTNKKENWSKTSLSLGVDYVHPLCPTVSYVGGISFNMNTAKEKESDINVKQQVVGLQLLGLRMNF